MQNETFQRFADYLGYGPGDRKRLALYMVLVDGASQTEASRATGYRQPQLSALMTRARRELARIKDLTGVDLCA